MAGRLSGRVAIVTGGGRGLGRAHALALAAHGARVIVNDLGGDVQGEGRDPTPAQQVVAEIRNAGGEAAVSGHDVSDWGEAEALIGMAVETFGDLHIVVNSEAEWDAVIRVHLKGHAATTRHAMALWRERSKAGREAKASLIHTTSLAGLVGTFGQANYAAAKLGIVALSRVVAVEGAKYGVRSNAISPSARTRIETSLKPPPPGVFDVFDPANVSPLVVWLASPDCPATGQVFQAYGNRVEVLAPSAIAADLRTEGRWTVEALDRALAGRLPAAPRLADFVEGL
jgi:NAD(P)-dependent dehydrogenase (short-subunit alcohol dehydrogenase family)